MNTQKLTDKGTAMNTQTQTQTQTQTIRRIPRARKTVLKPVPINPPQAEEIKAEEIMAEEIKAEEIKAVPQAPTDSAIALVAALQSRQDYAGTIQDNMVAIVTRISQAPKTAQIVHDRDLPYIFSSHVKGDDLSRLAQWLAGFTPIRIRFDKDTGRFKDVSVSDTWIKTRKNLGMGIWDLTGLSLANWLSYKPEIRKAPSDPAIMRGLQALARETARIVDTKGTGLDKIIADILKSFDEDFNSMVWEARKGEKHKDYVKRWKAHQTELAREKKPLEK